MPEAPAEYLSSSFLSILIPQFGLGLFLWWLINGLKTKVESLKGVVDAQKETIEVMGRRIKETEEIGGIYKKLLADLPKDLESYKKITSITKDEIILQLQNESAEAKSFIEQAKQEVEEVKSQLRSSGTNEVDIVAYARIAQTLATKHKNRYGHEADLDLKIISLFEGREIGNSVILLKAASSLGNYLHDLGFESRTLGDKSSLSCIWDQGKMPGKQGLEVRQSFYSETSRPDDWLLIANNNIWFGSERLQKLEDEFKLLRDE